MKPSYSNPFRVYSPLAAAFSVALFIHLAAPAAEAAGASMTWDATSGTAGAQDGSGTWTTALGNWRNVTASTDNQTWVNANLDFATFGAGTDGTYAVTVGGAITAAGISFVTSGYTLSASAARVITNNGSISVSATKSATIGANVTVTSSLVTGGGTLNVTGTATNAVGKLSSSGNITVTASKLVVGTFGAVTTSGSLVVGNDTTVGTLDVTGGDVILDNASSNIAIGNAAGASGGTVTLTNGNISVAGTAGGIRFGSGTNNSTGSDIFHLDGGILTVAKVYEGATSTPNSTFNFNGGTLTVLSTATSATVATFMTGLDTASVKAGGAIIDTNNHANLVTIGQNLLSGAGTDGGLTKKGLGTLVLTGSNTYNGTTTVSVGTLNIRHANSLGTTAGGTSVSNGATLQLQGTSISYAAESLSLGTGGSTTVLLQNVSGDNTWTGTITTTGSGSFARISSDSGLLTLANTLTGSDAASSVVFQGAGNILVSGQITGAAGIFSGSTGGGTRTVSNTGNDFSGDVNISGGILKLGANDVIPNGVGKGNVVFALTSTGTLDLNGKNETINGLSSSGAVSSVVDNTAVGTATLTVGDNDQTSTFGGVIKNTGGALALKKIGTGTLTLTNTNTYTGVTTISAGTLALGSAGTIASSPKIIVGDTGSSGTVLDVSAKSLGFAIVSGQTLSGIGTVDANTSATLGGGDGTKYTVTINGTHAVGNGPGSQTIDGNLSYSGASSIFEWDLNATNGADPGVVSNNGSYDKVAVTGDLGGAGAVFKVVLGANAFADAFWDTGKSWSDIYNVTGTSTDFSTIFTTVKWYEGTTEMTNSTATRGSFSVSGSTLTWSAVPEPTSALAGLLITAGLLRRRRA